MARAGVPAAVATFCSPSASTGSTNMNSMKKRRALALFIAAAAACAIAGGSSDASARGQSVAANCVKVGSAGSMTIGGDGSIANISSTQNLTVSCPIEWNVNDLIAAGSVE